MVWVRLDGSIEYVVFDPKQITRLDKKVQEADADIAVTLDGNRVDDYNDSAYPFFWLRHTDETGNLLLQWEEGENGEHLEFGVVPDRRFVYSQKSAITHADLSSLLLKAPPSKQHYKKCVFEYADSGRIWVRGRVIAMWGSNRSMSHELVRDIREAYEPKVGSILDFKLQFGDDPDPYEGPRTVRRWLEGYDQDDGDEEAAERSELNHQAHLLGAKAAGRDTSGAGSEVAAGVAGDLPVAAWRAQRSEESQARSLIEAAYPDLDADWAEMEREAVLKVREWVNAGILKGHRQGSLLITKPSPADAPGTVFRITSFAPNEEPFGHMEVSRENWKDWMANPQGAMRLTELGELYDAAKAAVRPDLMQGITGVTLDEPTEYRYRLRLRDVGIGTAPKGWTHANGRDVTYDRPLSRQELRDFEMDPVGATSRPKRVSEALKIRVPPFAQSAFFQDHGAEEEFWAMRAKPKTHAGEMIEFYFGSKPVASAKVSRVEAPGQSSCGHSGKFGNKWKVHWRDDSFRRLGESDEDAPVVGVISDDGVRFVQTWKTHREAGLGRGYTWRYAPSTQKVYWWERDDRTPEREEMVAAALEDAGFTVRGHTEMLPYIGGDDHWDIAHGTYQRGWRDRKMQFGRESA